MAPRNRKYTDAELGQWIKKKAQTAMGFRRNILANDTRAKDTTVIGRLYFFQYSAKHKDKLPIWDKFPLVFPIERYNDGFLGLNLHYLMYEERAILLNRLFKYRTNNRLDRSTRLKLSYDLLASTKTLNSVARPCIKRYLWTHVKSKFIEIEPQEWPMAIELPVEMWVVKKK